MRLEGVVCDVCGTEVLPSVATSWERRPSKFTAHCPPDGINGGEFNLDVCCECRRELNRAIMLTIDNLRRQAMDPEAYHAPRIRTDLSHTD